MANALAMEKAGINAETPNLSGGNIVRGPSGEAIGVFEENAMGAIRDEYREYTTTLSEEELLNIWHEGIELAESECLTKGVTSFQDAGSSLIEIERFKDLAEKGELDIRLWAMIRHTYEYLHDKVDGFPIIDVGDGFFTSRAVKLSIDGALGSYGAWLLEPYDDKPGAYGLNTSSLEELHKLAGLCGKHNLQFCVHAIGDRANREVLDAYEEIYHSISAKPEEFRWRVEHVQHLHPDDIPRFAEFGIIAAMQGIHCTSDAPFVEKRLGHKRAKEGAYAWQSLLKSGAVVTNGTDAPVEDVDPIESFYASVTRKRADSGMEFFVEQKMTRAQAIHSYTLACAYSAFEEGSKGSLEVGKFADIIILSEDLIHCAADKIMNTKVLMTMVGGKIKYATGNFAQ
jgi:predicted amidohydrolase YtcJ